MLKFINLKTEFSYSFHARKQKFSTKQKITANHEVD